MELFAICSTHEIDDHMARGFTLKRAVEKDGEKTGEPWSILITRKGRNFYGFENVCPHQAQRLDGGADEFMDDEGNFLVCRHHGAQFDLDTGHCFSGPCQGQNLKTIQVVVDENDVCVTGVELFDEDGLDLEDDGPVVMITDD
jgi:nitrite reductase/ring-hydroxylating ferredoxin subunit